jgi:hypothetical protein
MCGRASFASITGLCFLEWVPLVAIDLKSKCRRYFACPGYVPVSMQSKGSNKLGPMGVHRVDSLPGKESLYESHLVGDAETEQKDCREEREA